jgi:hypothetical protein
MPRPGLTHTEDLLLRLWDEVEDKTDIAMQDEIQDCVGAADLVGTVAGLKEKIDRAKDAAERIWIDDERAIGGTATILWDEPPYADPYTTEYVRADLRRDQSN